MKHDNSSNEHAILRTVFSVVMIAVLFLIALSTTFSFFVYIEHLPSHTDLLHPQRSKASLVIAGTFLAVDATADGRIYVETDSGSILVLSEGELVSEYVFPKNLDDHLLWKLDDDGNLDFALFENDTETSTFRVTVYSYNSEGELTSTVNTNEVSDDWFSDRSLKATYGSSSYICRGNKLYEIRSGMLPRTVLTSVSYGDVSTMYYYLVAVLAANLFIRYPWRKKEVAERKQAGKAESAIWVLISVFYVLEALSTAALIVYGIEKLSVIYPGFPAWVDPCYPYICLGLTLTSMLCIIIDHILNRKQRLCRKTAKSLGSC